MTPAQAAISAAELVAAGHTVIGLARSDASAVRLESLGATPHPGSLDDLDSMRRGAEAAGSVLHGVGEPAVTIKASLNRLRGHSASFHLARTNLTSVT